MLSHPVTFRNSLRQRVRGTVLQFIFNAAYTRLVFLHEIGGKVLFGSAWSARRLYVLADMCNGERILDVGCGEGHLLQLSRQMQVEAFGLEPSHQMRRRALNRGLHVDDGVAQSIPHPSDSLNRVVATYPGPWISDAATWGEISRVLRSTGRVIVLLGGSYERGQLALVRRMLARLVYGRVPGSADVDEQFMALSEASGIKLRVRRIHDKWGAAMVLDGFLADCL